MDRGGRTDTILVDIVRSALDTVVARSGPAAGALMDAMMLDVLDTVRRGVGADVAGFYEHERDGESYACFLDPEPTWQIVPFVRTPTAPVATAHPGIGHFLAHDPVRPFAITDVISERDWRSSEIYSLMRPDWGRNLHFAIPVDGGRRMPVARVWVLGRMQHSYLPADRDVATAIIPTLTAITAQFVRSRGAVTPWPDGLTLREQTVAEALLGTASTPVIAARLGISPRTVHKHAERIYRKLGVRSRPELSQTVRAAAIGNRYR